MIDASTVVQVSMAEIGAGFALLIGILWVFLKILAGQFRRELDLRFAGDAKLREERQGETDRRFAALDRHIQVEPEQWDKMRAEIGEQTKIHADIYGRLNGVAEGLAQTKGQLDGVRESLKPVRAQLDRINQYLLDKEA